MVAVTKKVFLYQTSHRRGDPPEPLEETALSVMVAAHVLPGSIDEGEFAAPPSW
jgi:hypothetical protein